MSWVLNEFGTQFPAFYLFSTSIQSHIWDVFILLLLFGKTCPKLPWVIVEDLPNQRSTVIKSSFRKKKIKAMQYPAECSFNFKHQPKQQGMLCSLLFI
jgi:hypothetical protein